MLFKLDKHFKSMCSPAQTPHGRKKPRVQSCCSWRCRSIAATVTWRHCSAYRLPQETSKYHSPTKNFLSMWNHRTRQCRTGASRASLPDLTLSANKLAKNHMRNNIWKRQMKVTAFILWEEHQEPLGFGMNDGFLFNKGFVNKAAIRDFLSEGQGAIG